MIDHLDISDEDRAKELRTAHGRVFILCATFSQEVRDLILDGNEPNASDEAAYHYAALVKFTIMEFIKEGLETGEGELSLGIGLKVGEDSDNRTLRVGNLSHYEIDEMDLDPVFVRRIIRELEARDRALIADYMLEDAESVIGVRLENNHRYDLLADLPARLEQFHAQIVAGHLPVPSWPRPPLS